MVNVIKVYLQRPDSKKTEIRRLAVNSEIISRFESLCVKVIELFPYLCGKIFEISWQDSEGDLILMSSDAELAQALANADDGLIKIYVSISEERHDDPDGRPVRDSVHPGVICDECNSKIYNARYKCLQCKDYDLCSTCNAANKHSHHDMLKLVEPIFVVRKWIGDLCARRMWKTLFGHKVTAHPSCAPEAEEKPSCPNKSDSPGSPTKIFHNFCASAEHLLNPDTLENLIKTAGQQHVVDVKLVGGYPGGYPVYGPFTLNFSQTDKDAKESQQDSSKGCKKEAKSPDSEASPATASSSVNEAAGFDATAKAAHEEKPEEKEQSPEGDHLSNTADGWTLLNKEEASKKTPERESSPPVEKVQDDKAEVKLESNPPVEKVQDDKTGGQEENHTADPKIANALLKMHAMGFTNEGGWLERLLITKQGNINEALDALYPNTQRH